MKRITIKIGTGIATVGILASALTMAAFADTTVDVSGNGNGSSNIVNIHTSNNTTISQGNESEITTVISTSNNTGGNSANNNTGGDVTVGSGDATSHINVKNSGGSNVATDPSCGCTTTGDTTLTIDGNGYKSHTKVSLKNSDSKIISQTNISSILNSISVTNKTGKNKGNNNTGGDVNLVSGDSSSTITITNKGNKNVLIPSI